MNTEVEEGQLVTINCTVDSYPASTLTLKKTLTLVSKERQNSLQHQFHVTPADSGWYSCYASNSQGFANSKQRKLVVKCEYSVVDYLFANQTTCIKSKLSMKYLISVKKNNVFLNRKKIFRIYSFHEKLSFDYQFLLE